MKTCLAVLATLFLGIAWTSARAELVFDSTQTPPEHNNWLGPGTYQEQGVPIALGGTARHLRSVTLRGFANLGPVVCDVTASIYAVPATIKDDGRLGKPLWTVKVRRSFAGGEGMHVADITFSGRRIRLPDKVVVVFKLRTHSGAAGLLCQAYAPGCPTPNGPAVGSIAALASYEGFGQFPATWHNFASGSKFLYPQCTIEANDGGGH